MLMVSLAVIKKMLQGLASRNYNSRVIIFCSTKEAQIIWSLLIIIDHLIRSLIVESLNRWIVDHPDVDMTLTDELNLFEDFQSFPCMALKIVWKCGICAST